MDLFADSFMKAVIKQPALIQICFRSKTKVFG